MRVVVLFAAALACGCQQEPSFDERYDQASEKIGKTAGEIDAELKRRELEAQPKQPEEPDTKAPPPNSI